MSQTLPFAPAGLQRDFAIASIRSTIADVPTVRRHELSSLSVTAQSYVIVELRLTNGVEGIGEAATLGGPRWSEESVESIKATIDVYLAPAIMEQARKGRLRCVLEPYAPTVPGFFLYYPSRAQRTPALKAFVDVARSASARALG